MKYIQISSALITAVSSFSIAAAVPMVKSAPATTVVTTGATTNTSTVASQPLADVARLVLPTLALPISKNTETPAIVNQDEPIVMPNSFNLRSILDLPNTLKDAYYPALAASSPELAESVDSISSLWSGSFENGMVKFLDLKSIYDSHTAKLLADYYRVFTGPEDAVTDELDTTNNNGQLEDPIFQITRILPKSLDIFMYHPLRNLRKIAIATIVRSQKVGITGGKIGANLVLVAAGIIPEHVHVPYISVMSAGGLVGSIFGGANALPNAALSGFIVGAKKGKGSSYLPNEVRLATMMYGMGFGAGVGPFFGAYFGAVTGFHVCKPYDLPETYYTDIVVAGFEKILVKLRIMNVDVGELQEEGFVVPSAHFEHNSGAGSSVVAGQRIETLLQDDTIFSTVGIWKAKAGDGLRNGFRSIKLAVRDQKKSDFAKYEYKYWKYTWKQEGLEEVKTTILRFKYQATNDDSVVAPSLLSIDTTESQIPIDLSIASASEIREDSHIVDITEVSYEEGVDTASSGSQWKLKWGYNLDSEEEAQIIEENSMLKEAVKKATELKQKATKKTVLGRIGQYLKSAFNL